MLNIRDLRVKFHSTGKEAVKGISFDILPGERWGLVGESGSGKSVTAMAITGLIERRLVEMKGQVLFGGKDFTKCSRSELRSIHGKDIGMVFQEPMTSLNPLMRVGKQIEETLKIHTDFSAEERKKLALEAMEQVGLPEPETTYYKYPHQLSGGQRQRVIIALALCCGAEFLIADEPTRNLDVTIQASILKLLKELQRKHGMTVLFIANNLSLVSAFCDRVGILYDSKIIEENTTAALIANPSRNTPRS